MATRKPARKGGLGRGLDALIPQDHPTGGYAEIAVVQVAPNPKQHPPAHR